MIEQLYAGLSQTIQNEDFSFLLLAFVKALKEQGIHVHRIQIPMNKNSGLRHPQYAVIILTWEEGDVDIQYIKHELFNARHNRFELLRSTPFAPVLDAPNTAHMTSLRSDNLEFALLMKLKHAGYTEYACAHMLLPHGSSQMFSIATKHSDGFGGDVVAVIERSLSLFALCLYGAYQSHVSSALAETYLGARTGENVLTGSMYRGVQESIDAGIMFCDVRGFTAMSEQLGAQGVVRVMNDVFEIIEAEVLKYGGEILKFIGDALLIIFPTSSCTENLAAHMIRSAVQSVLRVEEHGKKHNLSLSVGFGCHIGEVLYGNIGTPNRLDFTVMGPAVNLTSRLESMCKTLGAQLIVSPVVAEQHKDVLRSYGSHELKGVSQAIEIWGMPCNA